ncbi:tau 95 subunit of transcription factor TFIIIC [Tilletia horrida]|nr:tau 95 subunit of transcription factor TFIIIC [Tilletia horrida]
MSRDAGMSSAASVQAQGGGQPQPALSAFAPQTVQRLSRAHFLSIEYPGILQKTKKHNTREKIECTRGQGQDAMELDSDEDDDEDEGDGGDGDEDEDGDEDLDTSPLGRALSSLSPVPPPLNDPGTALDHLADVLQRNTRVLECRLGSVYTASSASSPSELDPLDMYRHPIVGDIMPSSDILCKITKRVWKRVRRRHSTTAATSETARGKKDCIKEYKVDMLGTISNTVRFRRMADFVFQPEFAPDIPGTKPDNAQVIRNAAGSYGPDASQTAYSQGEERDGEDEDSKNAGTVDLGGSVSVLRLQSMLRRMDCNAIANFSFAEPHSRYEEEVDGVKRSTAFLVPPPIFSRQEHSSGSQLVTYPKGDGQFERRYMNVQHYRGVGPTGIVLTALKDQPIPQGPDRVHERQIVYVNKDLLLFAERPVWSKLALVNQFSAEDQLNTTNTKFYLPQVGYIIYDGIFRDCIVRYGYDIRKERDSRFYQRIQFHFRIENPRQSGKASAMLQRAMSTSGTEGQIDEAQNEDEQGQGQGQEQEQQQQPAGEDEEGEGSDEEHDDRGFFPSRSSRGVRAAAQADSAGRINPKRNKGFAAAVAIAAAGPNKKPPATHIFDGVTNIASNALGNNYSLVDIVDPMLQDYIRVEGAVNLRKSLDPKTGWYTRVAWERIRTAVTVRVRGVRLQSRPATRAEVEEAVLHRMHMLKRGVSGLTQGPGEPSWLGVDDRVLASTARMDDWAEGRIASVSAEVETSQAARRGTTGGRNSSVRAHGVSEDAEGDQNENENEDEAMAEEAPSSSTRGSKGKDRATDPVQERDKDKGKARAVEPAPASRNESEAMDIDVESASESDSDDEGMAARASTFAAAGLPPGRTSAALSIRSQSEMAPHPPLKPSAPSQRLPPLPALEAPALPSDADAEAARLHALVPGPPPVPAPTQSSTMATASHQASASVQVPVLPAPSTTTLATGAPNEPATSRLQAPMPGSSASTTSAAGAGAGPAALQQPPEELPLPEAQAASSPPILASHGSSLDEIIQEVEEDDDDEFTPSASVRGRGRPRGRPRGSGRGRGRPRGSGLGRVGGAILASTDGQDGDVSVASAATASPGGSAAGFGLGGGTGLPRGSRPRGRPRGSRARGGLGRGAATGGGRPEAAVLPASSATLPFPAAAALDAPAQSQGMDVDVSSTSIAAGADSSSSPLAAHGQDVNTAALSSSSGSSTPVRGSRPRGRPRGSRTRGGLGRGAAIAAGASSPVSSSATNSPQLVSSPTTASAYPTTATSGARAPTQGMDVDPATDSSNAAAGGSGTVLGACGDDVSPTAPGSSPAPARGSRPRGRPRGSRARGGLGRGAATVAASLASSSATTSVQLIGLPATATAYPSAQAPTQGMDVDVPTTSAAAAASSSAPSMADAHGAGGGDGINTAAPSSSSSSSSSSSAAPARGSRPRGRPRGSRARGGPGRGRGA